MHEKKNHRNLGENTLDKSHLKRKYWTVIPKGWEKPIRLKNLGEEYTNERILARLKENSPAVRFELFQKARNEKKQYLLLTREDRINKVGGLRGLYLKYCYQLGYLPKYNQNPVRVHYYLRDDLLKCEKFSKQVRLLGKYQINTREELASFISRKEDELTKLSGSRDELRKVSRRVIPAEEKETLKLQISDVTKNMKVIREEIKLGKDIEVRSAELAERLEQVREDERKREAIQR